MKKILRRIVFYLYLVTILPMACAILSQWISPAAFWPLAFFGLTFPILILLQFIFLILMAILRSKAAFLPLLMILASWTPFVHTFQIPGKKNPENKSAAQVKVISYNVRLFDFYQWSGQPDASRGIFDYITENKPDILCLQEFLTQDQGKLSPARIGSELAFLPNSYIEYNYTVQNRKHGLAIYSRFPVIGSGHEHFSGTLNMGIYADLVIGTDTVRVYNTHLESLHFNRDEFQWIDDKSDTTSLSGDKITRIIYRMKSAYVRRSEQARQIRKDISQSPYPVIVCGDFNDTPVSYATTTIRKGLTDSFLSGGRWLGITYPDIKGPVRIDYILHSKEMESAGFKTGKVSHSDHRPVSCQIRVTSGR